MHDSKRFPYCHKLPGSISSISKRDTKDCISTYQYPEKSPVKDKLAYRVIFLYEGQDNKRVSDVLMASDFQNVNNWWGVVLRFKVTAPVQGEGKVPGWKQHGVIWCRRRYSDVGSNVTGYRKDKEEF